MPKKKPQSITDTPKVYIVGAYGQVGASIMSYHLALLIHQHFHFECIIIKNHKNEICQNNIIDHPVEFSSITFEQLEQTISENDYLISNPKNSHRFLGARLPGKKLMYVQSYTTFDLLDGFFDDYVSVSSFVSRYIKRTYGIKSKKIPPFTHENLIPKPLIPWSARPEGKILLMGKKHQDAILNLLEKILQQHYPKANYEFVKIIRGSLSQKKLIQTMGKYRYFLQLSTCEGFGLTPLEAMASGCTVLGFHGGGGLDYLKPGYNCNSVAYPNINDLCKRTAEMLINTKKAEKIASRGVNSIKKYSYQQYEKKWKKHLASFFNK